MTRWLQSRASKDAQIAQQAATIAELTAKLNAAHKHNDAQLEYARGVEADRDNWRKLNERLVADNTRLRAALAPFVARVRGARGRWTKGEVE